MSLPGLPFSKMHALGNDMLVLLADQGWALTTDQIHRLADRHRGIGFDQLLCIDHIEPAQHVCEYRIFNADGSEVWQCANGARCLAYYVVEQGLLAGDLIVLRTKRYQYQAQLLPTKQVRLYIEPSIIQINGDFINAAHSKPVYTLNCGEHSYEVTAVHVGNPHVVLWVDDIEHYPVSTVGAALAQHPSLSEGANVNIASVMDAKTIRLRTYERGVGETQACGSGACAAVIAGQITDRLQTTVTVLQRGGHTVEVSWNGQDRLHSTGPVSYVFDGLWLAG